jgi:hypothetical protein
MNRIDARFLDDSQIEKLGNTLMKLEMKMEELKTTVNFTDSDPNMSTSPPRRPHTRMTVCS